MIGSLAAPATVFVDADNTLWDTDSVFAHAQRNLLERVETATGIATTANDRLAYVRSLDQAIAERHHARLRYPPRILVRGLEAALGGVPAERAARAACRNSTLTRLPDCLVDEIEEAFFADLKCAPELRPGVYEGLDVLHAANCLVLVLTEGSRANVGKIAKRLTLDGFMSRIIEGPKRPELYRRVLRLAGTPKRAFMVGDQLESDIRPAKEAGLRTIYFPGGFRPRWEPVEAAVQPDYRVERFDEVPDIVLAECRGKLRGQSLLGSNPLSNAR